MSVDKSTRGRRYYEERGEEGEDDGDTPNEMGSESIEYYYECDEDEEPDASFVAKAKKHKQALGDDPGSAESLNRRSHKKRLKKRKRLARAAAAAVYAAQQLQQRQHQQQVQLQHPNPLLVGTPTPTPSHLPPPPMADNQHQPEFLTAAPAAEVEIKDEPIDDEYELAADSQFLQYRRARDRSGADAAARTDVSSSSEAGSRASSAIARPPGAASETPDFRSPLPEHLARRMPSGDVNERHRMPSRESDQFDQQRSQSQQQFASAPGLRDNAARGDPHRPLSQTHERQMYQQAPTPDGAHHQLMGPPAPYHAGQPPRQYYTPDGYPSQHEMQQQQSQHEIDAQLRRTRRRKPMYDRPVSSWQLKITPTDRPLQMKPKASRRKENAFVCPWCYSTFSFRSNFTRHLKCVHKADPREYDFLNFASDPQLSAIPRAAAAAAAAVAAAAAAASDIDLDGSLPPPDTPEPSFSGGYGLASFGLASSIGVRSGGRRSDEKQGYVDSESGGFYGGDGSSIADNISIADAFATDDISGDPMGYVDSESGGFYGGDGSSIADNISIADSFATDDISGDPMVNTRKPLQHGVDMNRLAESMLPTVSQAVRCGVCSNCTRPDNCNDCEFCLNPEAFKTKLLCIRRRCLVEMERILRKRSVRRQPRYGCGTCVQCEMPDCGICAFCVDSGVFGGLYFGGSLCLAKECSEQIDWKEHL